MPKTRPSRCTPSARSERCPARGAGRVHPRRPERFLRTFAYARSPTHVRLRTFAYARSPTHVRLRAIAYALAPTHWRERVGTDALERTRRGAGTYESTYAGTYAGNYERRAFGRRVGGRGSRRCPRKCRRKCRRPCAFVPMRQFQRVRANASVPVRIRSRVGSPPLIRRTVSVRRSAFVNCPVRMMGRSFSARLSRRYLPPAPARVTRVVISASKAVAAQPGWFHRPTVSRTTGVRGDSMVGRRSPTTNPCCSPTQHFRRAEASSERRSRLPGCCLPSS